MNAYTLIALANTSLVTEATNAAVAGGKEIKTCEDPRDIARLVSHAETIVVDSTTAAHVGALNPRAPVLFLAPDPGPIDYEAALRCRAEAAFIIPAQANDFLEALRTSTKTQPRKPGTDRCLATIASAGGLGTSTLAVALACSLRPSVLMDGNAHGGGIDLLMGLEKTPGLRWPDMGFGAGALEGTDILGVLPTNGDGVSVLSAARATVDDPFEISPKEFRLLANSLQTSHPLIVDDPPFFRSHPAGEGLFPGVIDHVVLVTAAEVRATAAAAGMVHRLAALDVSYSVVVRHRGWSSLSTPEIEQILGADVVAEIPTIKRLPRIAEQTGLSPGVPKALARACQLILEDLGWD